MARLLHNRGEDVRLHGVVVVVACSLLAFASLAEAHDFWLVPNAFRLAPGAAMEVRGQTSSSFPASEAAVAVDRVADARLLSSSGSVKITALSTDGTSLLLRHGPGRAGQRVVAVALHPRSVRESAAGFRRYLELEGAPDALARVDREGLLTGRDSVTRRYAKYAKTIVEIGSGGPRAFSRPAGYPLEFIPEHDPAALASGDTLVIRLLYRGNPLANAKLHTGFVPARDGRAQLTAVPSVPDLHVVTDARGRVRVPLTGSGLWNFRTLHVVQAEPNSGADWDTHWATLVFHIAGQDARSGVEAAAARARGSDSANVAGVVARYHQALAAGDSTTVLALLSNDALILESGGIESRAEYRSHHLPADIEFARAVTSERGPVGVIVRGDVAWASSTSVSQGQFRGRTINSAGAELMVLVRTDRGWKITAIHWSSRTRR